MNDIILLALYWKSKKKICEDMLFLINKLMKKNMPEIYSS